MIKYSASYSIIRNARPNALTELVSSLEKEYRELLDLREQVRQAEAASKRPAPGDKLRTCARPVARVLSRRPIARRSGELSKHQLYAMLAEAVRNTR